MKAQLAHPFINSGKNLKCEKSEKYQLNERYCGPVQTGQSTEELGTSCNFEVIASPSYGVDTCENGTVVTAPRIVAPIATGSSSLKIEEAEWLTSRQAAQYLQVSEATLRNMASNGSIPYVKLGRSNRYNRLELRQLLLSKRRGVKIWE